MSRKTILTLSLLMVVGISSACGSSSDGGVSSSNSFNSQEPGEPQVVGISVNKEPNKKEYYPYELFDPSGMTINLEYDDGSTDSISSRYCEIYPDDGLTTEQTHVIISYQSFETTQPITVYDATLNSIDVELGSNFSDIIGKEEGLDLSNINVMANYTLNGEEVELDVTKSAKFTLNNKSIANLNNVYVDKSGINEFKVIFGEKTFIKNIEVIDGAFSSLEIGLEGIEPTKLKNVTYDFSSLALYKVYKLSDNSYKKVKVNSDYSISIDGTNVTNLTNVIFNTTGISEIVAKLGNDTATKDIVVVDGYLLDQTNYHIDNNGVINLNVNSDGGLTNVVLNVSNEVDFNIKEKYELKVNDSLVELIDTTILADNNFDINLGKLNLLNGNNRITLTPKSVERMSINNVEVRKVADILVGGTKTIYKESNNDLSSLEVVLNPFSQPQLIPMSECELKVNNETITDLVNPKLVNGRNQIDVTYNQYKGSVDLFSYSDIENDPSIDNNFENYLIYEAEKSKLGGTPTNPKDEKTVMKVGGFAGASEQKALISIRGGHEMDFSFMSNKEKVVELYANIACSRDASYKYKPGQMFDIQFNGESVRLSENSTIVGGGSWTAFNDYYMGTITIPAGKIDAKVIMQNQSYNINLDYFRFVPVNQDANARLVVKNVPEHSETNTIDLSNISVFLEWGNDRNISLPLEDCIISINGNEVSDLSSINLDVGVNELKIKYNEYETSLNIYYGQGLIDLNYQNYKIEAEDMTLEGISSDGKGDVQRISNSNAASNGKYVSMIREGHTASYSFNSNSSVISNLTMRIATGRNNTYKYSPNQLFEIKINGEAATFTDEKIVVGTGGWTTFVEYKIGEVNIDKGEVLIEINYLGQSYNINLDYMYFEKVK